MSSLLVKASKVKIFEHSHEVCFDVSKGEVLCLYGMNGSGKTLLLKTLCGVFTPFSGQTEIFCQKEEVGVCLQFPEHLVFCDTALKEAQLITGSSLGAEKLLEEIGVERDSSPFFMSDGQKRLLFVYGLLESKGLLIFDEPFASLDGETKAETASKIRFAVENQGVGVIYTANRKADTSIADKIVTIDKTLVARA